MDLNGKKRKIADENGSFKVECTEMYAFIVNANGCPVFLICNEKLSNMEKTDFPVEPG